jgi:hypothetical protein
VVVAVAWLPGHWLYGVRRHHFGLALASRLFQRRHNAVSTPSAAGGVPTIADEHEPRTRPA